jgi:hypothetical protein
LRSGCRDASRVALSSVDTNPVPNAAAAFSLFFYIGIKIKVSGFIEKTIPRRTRRRLDPSDDPVAESGNLPMPIGHAMLERRKEEGGATKPAIMGLLEPGIGWDLSETIT